MKRLLLLIIVIISFTVSGCGNWFVYHKPEFSGKVLDAETKEPIEGAVVVAVYNKETLGLGAGSLSSIINVREALTNKDGMFHIPSYTTVMQPFSWAYATTFVVFMPGYASVKEINLEKYLSEEVGKELELPWFYNNNLKFRFAPRMIGLPKVKTREERKQAWMDADIIGAEIKVGELPLLYKMINDEEINSRF